MDKVCNYCGQIEGVTEYDRKLWDIYYRLPDMIPRSYIEPFVYTGEDLQELGFYDDEDSRESVMLSMERNMIERGLCGGCGRPSLKDRDMSELMTEEDARELHEMYAEEAAERRMGC